MNDEWRNAQQAWLILAKDKNVEHTKRRAAGADVVQNNLKTSIDESQNDQIADGDRPRLDVSLLGCNMIDMYYRLDRSVARGESSIRAPRESEWETSAVTLTPSIIL